MPYTPGPTSRAGEFLAQGIMSAADSISSGIQKRQEKSEQAKRLRKGLSGLYPERKDEFEAMGLSELMGTQDTLVMQRAKQLDDQQKQQQELQRQLLQQQITQATNQNQQQGASTRFNENLQKYFQTPETIRRPVNPEMLLQMAAQSNLNPQALDPRLLEQFAARGQDPVARLNAEAAMRNAEANDTNARVNQLKAMGVDFSSAAKPKPMTTRDRLAVEDKIQELRDQFAVADPMVKGGLRARIQRMEAMLDGGGTAPAKAAPAGKAEDPNAPVTVIDPSGKPGTIPRRQLEAALKRGYKLQQ